MIFLIFNFVNFELFILSLQFSVKNKTCSTKCDNLRVNAMNDNF